MASSNELIPERHRVIVVYLIIVFAFLMLGFAVWAYYDFKGLELQTRTRTTEQPTN